MPKISIKMPPFSGVAAGQTAIAALPIGRRYHDLKLVYGGATLAQLNEIRIKANGEVIHRYSGGERDTMNVFDGRNAAAGILVLPFNRYNLLQREAEEATALNTGVKDAQGRMIATLTVEVDIDAAAVAPVLSLTASQSNSLAGGPGVVLRIKKEERQLIDGLELDNLAGGISGQNPTAEMLNRIFFASANITEVTIRRDNFDIFDRLKAENDLVQSDGVRVPQAGYFVVDPSEEGYGGEAFQMAGYQDFRFRLSASAAATMTVLSEFLGQLGG